ncbi:hypothetical protein [Marinilabilia rubra]|uniref:Outer membrane protein beta-barrel domain-containing protein n=1 Tax=Marinilabilia rubra TaxID=2162893 RepID=A0A2U2B5D7_9BACT|nr:hypothetical protein [Marinilabilia rubra]PWD98265.1 hypothetical protein DDZ16_16670 [Marinilabilia rubra]
MTKAKHYTPTKKTLAILVLLAFIKPVLSQAQSTDDKSTSKHSFETSPMSPFMQSAGMGIWGIKYDYAINPKNELKFGIAYMNLNFPEGTTNSPALIFGFRRFLTKNIYAEYEIWPGYDNFYEQNESKHYKGFDLWNEFRIGYRFNFNYKNLPLFVNIAWPFGFGLYNSNKPKSFYERMNQSFSDRFFFQIPLLFAGIKI